MQDFKNLVVWQKSHKLTVQVPGICVSAARNWLVPSVPAGTGRDLSPGEHC